MLDIRGTVVSIDAMGCQRDITRQIVENGGDYILSLKGNQSTMHDEVTWWLDHAIAGQLPEARLDYHKQMDKDHGRVETRKVWSTEQVEWFADRDRWAGLNALVAVESQRRWPDGRHQQERRYFISSLSGAGTKRFAESIRQHWHIENKLHWSLDMSFNEDACRVRKGYAAENLSRLRRMALNLLKRETTENVGIKTKRLRAGWDKDYLLKVLTG